MGLNIDLVEKCSECGHDEGYDANITHNLTAMADEAGIYDCLWRAPENGFEHAIQLIEPLSKAIKDMKERPDHYRQFDPENRWGTYDAFVPWLDELLANCRRIPSAKIVTSR